MTENLLLIGVPVINMSCNVQNVKKLNFNLKGTNTFSLNYYSNACRLTSTHQQLNKILLQCTGAGPAFPTKNVALDRLICCC